MVFWWYQSGTILPLAYSFLIALFTLRFLKTEIRIAKLGYSLLLSYILICFALILYPPFQIACLSVVITYLVGWVLENYRGWPKFKKLLSLWPYILLILVLVASTGILFYYTRKGVIHTITSTVYPGSRNEVSGGTPPLLAFSSFLSPNLQYDAKAAVGYLGNQSEASNFIFLAPYLLLPSLYLIYRRKKQDNKVLWELIGINALIVFLLVRMYISTPWLEPIYHIFLLNKVPSTRLLLGVGLAGVFQLILLIKALDKTNLSKYEIRIMALVGALSSLVTMLLIGSYTIAHFPIFISNFAKVSVFALWISLSIFLILKKRFIPGLILLTVFSLISIYKVHPLYRGLFPSVNSKIISAIQSYPTKDSWVVLDNRLLINFPIMAGRHSINSVQMYPQLKLWSQIDKNGKYQYIYNRYAHVVFIDDKQMTEPFELKYTDTMYVKFEPCKNFIQTNAQYVLSVKLLDEGCVHLDKTITLPQSNLFVYKITTPLP